MPAEAGRFVVYLFTPGTFCEVRRRLLGKLPASFTGRCVKVAVAERNGAGMPLLIGKAEPGRGSPVSPQQLARVRPAGAAPLRAALPTPRVAPQEFLAASAFAPRRRRWPSFPLKQKPSEIKKRTRKLCERRMCSKVFRNRAELSHFAAFGQGTVLVAIGYVALC